MFSCLQNELSCCGGLISVLRRPVMRKNLIIQIHQLAKVLDDATEVCSISIPDHVQPERLIVVMGCFRHILEG